MVFSGLGMLWVNGRVNQRLIVTLNNSQEKPDNQEQSANDSPTNSDVILDPKSLDAKNFLLTGSDNGSCADAKSKTTGGIGDRQET
jgi:hypothetical protein